MKMLLQVVMCGLVLLGAGRVESATDVPLTGTPVASFGPGTLEVVVGGVGLVTQPATFSVVVPNGGTVVAAYLYINGRGVGDGDVQVNGTTVGMPVVASSDMLPLEGCPHIETRRVELTGALALEAGSNTLTIDGYDQCAPGGAFVVAVVNRATAPVRTIDILEGADYAYHGFTPPFGPNTEVGAFSFAPYAGTRAGHLFLFTHDAEAERSDAIWTLTAPSSTTPIPASLTGGASGSALLEIDRLGVPTASGGFSVGPELDIVSHDVSVPTGADYLAFQVESPAGGNGDSVGLSVAVLALTAGAGPGPGDGPGACGNRVLDVEEACDDGNIVDGDGCSSSCALEAQAKTVDAIFRVRKHRRERLWYFSQLPGLASDLVGTTPVHVTLVANGVPLLDIEVPAKAWQRVEPRATNAVPSGKFASTRGRVGDTSLRYLRLWPMSQKPVYNFKFKAKREMLKRAAGISELTSIIRIGDQVFTTTDQMQIRRKGKVLRNTGN